MRTIIYLLLFLVFVLVTVHFAGIAQGRPERQPFAAGHGFKYNGSEYVAEFVSTDET
jgi:hypothetical protein